MTTLSVVHTYTQAEASSHTHTRTSQCVRYGASLYPLIHHTQAWLVRCIMIHLVSLTTCEQTDREPTSDTSYDPFGVSDNV